jgi:poly(hydroxyalkanoate) depolymerase family esterase
MNPIPQTDMLEATRLTREGRLAEAMTILHRVLPGVAATPPLPGAKGHADARRAPPMLDVSPRSGGADGSAAGRTPGTVDFGAAMPEALRDFLGRMGRGGAALSLDGLGTVSRAPAPAPLPPGARFEDHVFTNEAGSRAYKLYVPSGYTGQALPLIVMLHGCTQSPDDFAAGTGMNAVAEEHTMLVAYPAQAQSANASKCWNWFNAAHQRRDGGEPSLIAGITRRVMRDFAVDPARVYVAGLSAGGAAAAVMGATYPDLYAAVGVHSGLACGAASDLASAFAAMKQGGPASAGRGERAAERAVPTIVFHGDRDGTVNPVNGAQVAAQSKAAAHLRRTVSRGRAAGGIAYTRIVDADQSGRPVVEHWVLHGAGHAWSGGSLAGSYTDPRGPDASREMLRFFLDNARQCDGTV